MSAQIPTSFPIGDGRPRYQYSLLGGPDRLRILVLEPGQLEDDISCCLSLVSPSNPLEYEPISYTWGTDEKSHIAFHEGDAIISLTTNLHTALSRLRHLHEPRRLWVDAIFINQEDLLERNEQVKIMGFIYQQATEVVVCLGPISAADAAQIVVDYELPCEELFTSIAAHYIVQPEWSFWAISSVGYNSKTSVMHLPSWLPNWASISDGKAGQNMLHIYSQYSAAADTEADISMTACQRIIVIAGYLFDSIEAVSKSLPVIGSQTKGTDRMKS